MRRLALNQARFALVPVLAPLVVPVLALLVAGAGCRGCSRGDGDHSQGRALNRPRAGCAACATRHARFSDAVLLDLSRRRGPLANRATTERGATLHRYRLRSPGGQLFVELTARPATRARLELSVYRGDGSPASSGQRIERCTGDPCTIELSVDSQRGEELLVRVVRSPPGTYRIRARPR